MAKRKRRHQRVHRPPDPSARRSEKARRKAEKKAVRRAMRAVDSDHFPEDGPKKAYLFTTIRQWVTDDTNADKESDRGLWI